MTDALFDLRAAPEAPPEAGIEPVTERDILDLLRLRYGFRYGNGIRYASAEHVRSHAGFDARRTADFIAMDLWPSKGMHLHGHEVKVSRSDWLTELKQPEKAQEFIPYMDHWWLVVSDRRIVRDGELPATWGLLAPRGDQLVVVRAAPRLESVPLTRTRLAALLRAVSKTAAADHDVKADAGWCGCTHAGPCPQCCPAPDPSASVAPQPEETEQDA